MGGGTEGWGEVESRVGTDKMESGREVGRREEVKQWLTVASMLCADLTLRSRWPRAN